MPKKGSTDSGNSRSAMAGADLDLSAPKCHYVEETKVRHYTVAEIENYYRKRGGGELVLPFVANSGLGLSQGLVSPFFGSKGDIIVMGKALKEIALDAADRFASLLPADDWLVYAPADLVIYWNETDTETGWMPPLEEVEVVVLGIPGQGEMADPPLPSVFAVRRRFLQVIEDEMSQCLRYCGISIKKRDPFLKANWWALLIRPVLLTSKQWRVASGIEDLSEETQIKIWAYAQGFAHRVRICTITLKLVSTNANGNKDLYTLYQRMLGHSPGFDTEDAAKLRELFEVPSGSKIKTEFSGNVTMGRSCLMRGSTVSAERGVRVRIGDRVVIDDSEIHVVGSFGSEYFIPEGTVFAHCRISGEFVGNESGGALIGVESSEVINFHGQATQTTVFFKDGRRLIGIIPFHLSPKQCIDWGVPGLGGLTLREALKLAQPGYRGPKKRFALDDDERES